MEYIIKLKKSVLKAKTISDVLRNLNIKDNGRNRKYIKSILNENKIDISHLKFVPKNKLPRIIKICPVCNIKFETVLHGSDEKTVCSRSCSNTYFRSGKNNGMWNKDYISYRNICFKYHKKECIICGETLIVGVHHYDGIKKNNSPDNLIPLCPTHHTYWHSKYKYLIENQVKDYRNKFIKMRP